jgi:hypothetical protein
VTLFSRLVRQMRRIDQRRCAPKFAQRLGPRLLKDYGASKFYTPGQIRAACTKCRLPHRHLVLAYAAFLSPSEFEQTVDVAARGHYHTLRNLFFRFSSEGEDFTVAPSLVNSRVAQILGHRGNDRGDGLPR